MPQAIFDQTALERQLTQLPQMLTTGDVGTLPADPRPADTPSAGVSPYAALFLGQAADAASSIVRFHQGATEQNPLYSWMGDRPTVGLLLTKGIMTLMAARKMEQLTREGHPGQAKAIGYALGALGAVPAVYNAAQAGRPQTGSR